MPDIKSVANLAPDQSLICVIGSKGELPDLKLSVSETKYIKRCLADSKEIVVVNSYHKLTIIVKEKEGLSLSDFFEDLRKEGVKIAAEISQKKQSVVGVMEHKATAGSVDALVEGIILSSYKFNKYKTIKDEDNSKIYPEVLEIKNADSEFIQKVKFLSEAVFFARDKVNEPLSHLSAVDFSKSISDFCTKAGLTVETLTRKQIEALKMGGLIGVNKGSNDPPTFSIIEWKPSDALNEKPIILIGKGVVFDTGGLNLKPTNYIEEMKSDMAGGAAVAAVMYYVASRKLPLNIKALVPATDNRPGQDAYAPGDVLKMYNGMTVEVLNTDAEGRLILADALSYADKYSPSLVITIATLTGSAQMAFGNKAIATMGNANREIMNLLKESGNLSFERIAEMPFWDDYAEWIKSDIADMKNIGGREGGAITAGKFLEKFTKAPFIHLDIAGTGMQKEKDHYRPKGGTGSGVRLLAVFMENLVSGNIDKLN